MVTSMHRLQISLPQSQAQFLAERARRDGVSIAEVIRQLVQREEEASAARQSSADSIWEIVGMITHEQPLIDGIPVSEQPDLYLAEAAVPRSLAEPTTAFRARRPRRKAKR